jgi:hypothetical protein
MGYFSPTPWPTWLLTAMTMLSRSARRLSPPVRPYNKYYYFPN